MKPLSQHPQHVINRQKHAENMQRIRDGLPPLPAPRRARGHGSGSGSGCGLAKAIPLATVTLFCDNKRK